MRNLKMYLISASLFPALLASGCGHLATAARPAVSKRQATFAASLVGSPSLVLTQILDLEMERRALQEANPEWIGREMRDWRAIVIHHSGRLAGNAAVLHQEALASGAPLGLAYHFVIGNGTGSGDGQIEYGPRWRQQQTSSHTGHLYYDEYGISICLIGDLDRAPPTPRQTAALGRLTRFLQARFGIARRFILLPGRIAAANRTQSSPGRHFAYAAFLGEVIGQPQGTLAQRSTPGAGLQ